MSIARRIWPRSLVWQLILLVALALFVAQAINFAILLRERDRQQLIGATAPSVARIVDALDRRTSGPHMRVEEGAKPPPPVGERRNDIEQRASELFAEIDVPVLQVQAYTVQDDAPIGRWERSRLKINPGRLRDQRKLTLAVEHAPGQWMWTQTRMTTGGPRVGGWLVGQTLILYICVLAPLLWVGRRLASPLKSLTVAARQFGSTGVADPVVERGPGDVHDLTVAFNSMRQRLRAMLDEKDRMLGAIGHDLRTPLASLRVRTESVEDEGERQRMSDTIEEMSRMLDDILSLARAGKSIEPEVRTDLAALADAVVEDYIELGSAVELIEGPRAVGTVRPQLVRRALRNLVENAVVYGGKAEVSVMKEGDTIRIVVADRGPGIAENRMAEMMEPFTRLEGSRNRHTGGAGLGLALVRAIMIEHRGTLQLRNRDKGGLEASLVFPA